MAVTMSEAIDYLKDMEHGLVIAVGSGKQGKSCSIHSLIALCWPDRPVYMLDPLDYDISAFPGYRKVSQTKDIPVGAVTVIEDVNRIFHSRGSSKNTDIQGWLSIISHKSNVVCLTTQNMADTDIAFVRSQDVVILNKYMHEEDLMFERPEFVKSQAEANYWIDQAWRQYPHVDRRAWCFFPRFKVCSAIPKVSWWTYRNSHMLRDVVI